MIQTKHPGRDSINSGVSHRKLCLLSGGQGGGHAPDAEDLGESNKLATTMPEKCGKMKELLEKPISEGRRTPVAKQLDDLEDVRFWIADFNQP